MSKKVIVVLSGGMDSATALGYAVATLGRENVETLTFNYGSKHNDIENECAEKLSKYYAVPNTIVKLPFINEIFKSDLLKSGGDIPEGHYADPSMKRTVVPFRNGIMLSIAAGFAESRGAKYLMLGAHSGDHAIYPDCRPEWTAAMANAIFLGGFGEIELMAPFVRISKTDICRLGSRLAVPYRLTYSCYNGRDQHCGKCGTCFERIEAFREAGVLDPTVYESEAP